MVTRSDPRLVADVRRFGRFDTNACVQCGTCTLSCDLTRYGATFPRRPLRLAMLGLRDALHHSLDPWLCFYCGDCTTACPREAEPAEGLMTLRRYLASRYDWTGLSRKVLRSAVWEIGAILVVALVVLGLAVYQHVVEMEMQFGDLADGEWAGLVGLGHMFPTVQTFTNVVFLLGAFFLASHALRMWWITMHRGDGRGIPLRIYLTQAWTFVWHGLTQWRWRQCTDRRRWSTHLLLFVGFVVMTLLLLVDLPWFQTDRVLPVTHPQRWLGYLAAGTMLFACADILVGRIRRRRDLHRFSEASDWILPVMLLLTAASGIAVHVLRLSGEPLWTLWVYSAHLAIAAPLVVVEVPFGKGSHMIYRPLAIYFQAVKERAAEEQAAREAVAGAVHAG